MSQLSSLSTRRGLARVSFVVTFARSHWVAMTSSDCLTLNRPSLLFLSETHDFAHTLFGLPANLIPEIALKMFEAHQTKLPMPLLSSLTVLSPFNTLTSSGRATLLRDYLPWAIRAADECRPLIGVYWERRWEQGMDDLRQELGVVMPGHWEGTAFRRGTLKERERETLQKQEMEREARQLEEAAREASKKAHDAEAEGKVAVTMGS